jgi:hypothetical protein
MGISQSIPSILFILSFLLSAYVVSPWRRW